MLPSEHSLADGTTLLIRPAAVTDAAALLAYFETVSGETDFLTFGPGEFGFSMAEEEAVLKKAACKEGELYLVGVVDGRIVGALTFSAGKRPRIRHTGEFGLSIGKAYWGLGVGALMLDRLLDWARLGQVITKINLRVRSDNERAIRLYERKGFVRDGTISRESCIGGAYFSCYHMGLGCST